jgi:hypothetical protein
MGNKKDSDRALNFGEFSEFFHDLQQEIAAQAFEAVADSDNTVSFEDAVPLIQMVAPGHFKRDMQKNLTQLLAMYGDSRISYPAFRAFTTLLEKHHYIESAIYRQCQKKGRKITRSEFAGMFLLSFCFFLSSFYFFVRHCFEFFVSSLLTCVILHRLNFFLVPSDFPFLLLRSPSPSPPLLPSHDAQRQPWWRVLTGPSRMS